MLGHPFLAHDLTLCRSALLRPIAGLTGFMCRRRDKKMLTEELEARIYSSAINQSKIGAITLTPSLKHTPTYYTHVCQ